MDARKVMLIQRIAALLETLPSEQVELLLNELEQRFKGNRSDDPSGL